jgi:hypothetical protein
MRDQWTTVQGLNDSEQQRHVFRIVLGINVGMFLLESAA